MVAEAQKTAFICPVHTLRKALSFVGGAIANNPIIPALSCVLMKIENGILTLTGSDLTITLSSTIAVEAMEDCSVAIPYQTLSSLLATIPEQPLVFSLEMGDLVHITTDTGAFMIPGENPQSYPLKQRGQDDDTYKVTFSGSDRDAFVRGLTCTLFAIPPQNASKEEREGVFWHGTEMASTDNFRLVRITNLASIDDRNCFIPAKTAALFSKLAGSNDGDIQVEIARQWVNFSVSNYALYSPLKEDRFPDYKGAFAGYSPVCWQIDRVSLIGAISRLLVLSNSVTNLIILNGDPKGVVSISTNDVDLSRSGDEKIKASVNGPMRIGANGKLLAECLKNLTGETVNIALSAPNRAWILTGDNEDVTMLFMPREV